MSVGQRVADDHQLARLLQIGVVLEEVVQARATKHIQSGEPPGTELEALLETAVERADAHRARLETLIEELEADSVAYEDIEPLVAAQYQTDQDFDDIIYDQLCNAETAYKFFDDLIDAVEDSDAAFSVDEDRLLAVLTEIREAEAAGVEAVTDLMEDRA